MTVVARVARAPSAVCGWCKGRGMQVEHGRRADVPMELPGEKAIVYGFLALFAILLALVTSRHAMFGDEAQAWLIARDSGNLLELAHHLRYEGHPALWYLLLYLPAHLSASLVWMQALNYVLSVAMAWMVLTERRLPLAMRVMAVFGVFVFFHMGLMARNYMLAAVLLVGAARCLLAGRPRHWLAMVLLALGRQRPRFCHPCRRGHLRLVLLAGSGAQPANCGWPPERVAILDFSRASWCGPAGLLLHGAAGAGWRDTRLQLSRRILAGLSGDRHRPAVEFFCAFHPADAGGTVARKAHPRVASIDGGGGLSVALWLLIVSSLATRRSRWFFVSTSLAWMAAVWATVHAPSPHHTSTLFVVFLVALMLNVPGKGERPWLPFRYAQPVLVVLLAMQMAMSIEYSVLAGSIRFRVPRRRPSGWNARD